MNTKNNKRRRESVAKIEKIFIELLQTKSLNQITVSDICKKAELNRSTFYANYIDIYDLADKIREYLESEINRLYQDEQINQFNSNDYLRLFRHIKDNQLFYKTYFKLGYDNNYKILFYDTVQAEKYFGNKHIEYHIEFFKCGLNAIIKKWLENNCLETPEEMAEIIQSEYQGRI
ncbi:MAG: TetR-like C-terminal domain-containing protein [bacterium]|nr:TetR-like C-terminal domain-containing protein [bacterium]